MYRHRVFSALHTVVLLCCMAACGGVGSNISEDTTCKPGAKSTASLSEQSDITSAAATWADSVVNSLSISQLAAQVLMPASYTSTDAATLSRLTNYVCTLEVGGIAFHKGDTASMRLIADSLQSATHIPLFLAIDAENGLGMRLQGAATYPLNYKLTEASQTQMYDYGQAVGKDCHRVGINMVFGPVLDVVSDPHCYMYKRSLGTDPNRVAEQAIAYARGLLDTGVMPVGKHFPGLGRSKTDPHKQLPVINAVAEEIEKTDLMPFIRYIENGFPAIMAAHVAMPALSPDSLPADMSPYLMGTLLRDEMNFDGLVITDAVNMGALRRIVNDSLPPVVRAIQAGADIILAPVDTPQALEQIVQAVTRGQISVQRLRECCRRILFYKYLALLR